MSRKLKKGEVTFDRLRSSRETSWNWDRGNFEMRRREEGNSRQRKQHEQWHKDEKWGYLGKVDKSSLVPTIH